MKSKDINSFAIKNKSSVQESKPARPRFIVNPATGRYESTAYIPPKAKPMSILTYVDKVKANYSKKPVIEDPPLRDIEQPFGSIINNLKKKKISVAVEPIKSIKPIEHQIIRDFTKDLRERKESKARSEALDMQYANLFRPRVNPDDDKGLLSIPTNIKKPKGVKWVAQEYQS